MKSSNLWALRTCTVTENNRKHFLHVILAYAIWWSFITWPWAESFTQLHRKSHHKEFLWLTLTYPFPSLEFLAIVSCISYGGWNRGRGAGHNIAPLGCAIFSPRSMVKCEFSDLWSIPKRSDGTNEQTTPVSAFYSSNLSWTVAKTEMPYLWLAKGSSSEWIIMKSSLKLPSTLLYTLV